jgi:tetratricopeptide (TPR) repeat protein
VTLPVLALVAGGWLLVNASDPAVLLRARALAEKPPGLIEPHAAALHDWLGQRAMDLGEPAYAAPEFERSFELNRNPRRALLAAEAWARAGDLGQARAMLARAQAAGPLSPSVAESARRLAELIAALAADTTGSAAPPAPAGH